MGLTSSVHNSGKQDLQDSVEMTLYNLPYDLLLNISQYLAVREIHALQLTCKTLHEFTITRPVYRELAFSLLGRCRALPLTGFQRLSDLTTGELMDAVNKAALFERAWHSRAPRPIPISDKNYGKWYKIVSAPPNEEVDWLSPITSSYTLCATKSGKVVCWDVLADRGLSEWNPGEKWELWKCRVEFDRKMVYFTMAKLATSPQVLDDDRVMNFVLMQLTFPNCSPSDGDGNTSPKLEIPEFSQITSFNTSGVVMNVFLLDPPRKLLACFVWVSQPNTIGLFTLLDWDTQEYSFIDTGIECLPTSNWTCMLYEDQLVVHSEEADGAFQHFYPLSLLHQHKRHLSPDNPVPIMTGRIVPPRTQTKSFVYPSIPPSWSTTTDEAVPPSTASEEGTTQNRSDISRLSSVPDPAPSLPTPPPSSSPSILSSMLASAAAMTSASTSTAPAIVLPDSGTEVSTLVQPPAAATMQTPSANPFPSPLWYPESAHFVRQWWPSLPGVSRVSCTVVLMVAQDPETHHARYAFAQHYFKVPFYNEESDESTGGENKDATVTSASSSKDPLDPFMMKMWYVTTPFEVVAVSEATEDEPQDRSRPLVAVDFGHAAWIEYCDSYRVQGGREEKCLRFVTFPPMGAVAGVDGGLTEGVVRTLEVPDEVDLETIETINIDQSQGAVILSSTEGKIYFLFYT